MSPEHKTSSLWVSTGRSSCRSAPNPSQSVVGLLRQLSLSGSLAERLAPGSGSASASRHDGHRRFAITAYTEMPCNSYTSGGKCRPTAGRVLQTDPTEMAGEIADISLQNTAKAAGRPRGGHSKKGNRATLRGSRAVRLTGGRAPRQCSSTARPRHWRARLSKWRSPAIRQRCGCASTAPRRRAVSSRFRSTCRLSSAPPRSRARWRRSWVRRRGQDHRPRGIRLVADDRDLSARDRRHRFRMAPAAIGRGAGRCAHAIPLTTPNDRPSQTERCTRKPPFNFCPISSDM